MEIREIIVPTMDTARYKYLVDICLTSRQPLSYIGVTGTGKSAYVREKLMRDIDDETYRPFFINFSAQTSANQVQVRFVIFEFVSRQSIEHEISD